MVRQSSVCDFRFIKINSNQFENSKEQFHRFIFKKLLSFSSLSSRESLTTLSRESRESLESSTSNLESLSRESRESLERVSRLFGDDLKTLKKYLATRTTYKRLCRRDSLTRLITPAR
jgi:hypothetical protein